MTKLEILRGALLLNTACIMIQMDLKYRKFDGRTSYNMRFDRCKIDEAKRTLF